MYYTNAAYNIVCTSLDACSGKCLVSGCYRPIPFLTIGLQRILMRYKSNSVSMDCAKHQSKRYFPKPLVMRNLS